MHGQQHQLEEPCAKDESRGKPNWVGVYASERLSLTGFGKTSWGEAKVTKPDSGDPTVRECRGVSGTVTLRWDQEPIFIEKGGHGHSPLRVRAPDFYLDPGNCRSSR